MSDSIKMAANYIAPNKIASVTKLRTEPYVFPYHPIPSSLDPVDYTTMLVNSIFGYTIGYDGKSKFYPHRGMLVENPEFNLIRSPHEYLENGDGSKFKGVPIGH